LRLLDTNDEEGDVLDELTNVLTKFGTPFVHNGFGDVPENIL
jgi:hypothetical protein